MTKIQLAEAVMKACNIETKAQATRIVDAIFSIIAKEMSRGEDVAVSGFGKFRVARRKAREGRNPKTGATIQIAASVKPKFSAAKALKEMVK